MLKFTFAVLTNIVLHFLWDNVNTEEYHRIFYISAYSSKVFPFWVATSVLCAITYFLVGYLLRNNLIISPIYVFKVLRFLKNSGDEEFEIDYSVEDEIRENIGVSKKMIILRRIVSYLATSVLFALTAGGTFLGAALGEQSEGNIW